MLPFTLTRPLISLDVETHDEGPPEQARIVELGFCVLYPHCTTCHGLGRLNTLLLDFDSRCADCGGCGMTAPPLRQATFVKPPVPIAPGATAVHGITDEELVSAPTFEELAPSIAAIFSDCDYLGYYVRYDLRVLAAEMIRAGVMWSVGNARMIDAHRIWQIAEPRTLTDATREFLNREPTGAHRALTDAEDSLAIVCAQIEYFGHLFPDPRQCTPKSIHDLCFDTNNVDLEGKFIWVGDEIVCHFGKHGEAKTRLKDIPPGYLRWMLRKEFSGDVKKLVQDALKGVYPVREP